MMQPKMRALPELSFDISIINLHPVVVKLLASKVTMVTYGQTMQTTLDENEAKLGAFVLFYQNVA